VWGNLQRLCINVNNSRVNYTLEIDGEVILIENVPARVCAETGEQLFAPETLEKIQNLIISSRMQIPVF
jgi:YgiT-type zinc finger domain-containing protein